MNAAIICFIEGFIISCVTCAASLYLYGGYLTRKLEAEHKKKVMLLELEISQLNDELYSKKYEKS